MVAGSGLVTTGFGALVPDVFGVRPVWTPNLIREIFNFKSDCAIVF